MTPFLHPVINDLALAVQPLVFETGFADFPYSTAGTVFLVRYEGVPYILTARHALQQDDPTPVCIFPSDVSQRIVPLKDSFYVPSSEIDEDFMDFAVISIDVEKATHPEVARAKLIDLDAACGDWLDLAPDLPFFVIGFPRDGSQVDDEAQVIRADRIILFGKYEGPSDMRHLHQMRIADVGSLETFSGFSGAPVFAWIRRPQQEAVPTLCGMALRDSTESKIIHFLDREVLLKALAEIGARQNLE